MRPLSDTNANRATREASSGRKTDPAEEHFDTEEDKSLTPFFDYALLSRAPRLLQDMLRPDLTGPPARHRTGRALVALSTVTPHVTGQYHGHTDAPTLYLYVVASPGFGKGILQEVRKALLVWQQYIRDNSRLRVQKYEEELEAYNHHNTAARKARQDPHPAPSPGSETDGARHPRHHHPGQAHRAAQNQRALSRPDV